jgi:circadian clock protein KaiC
MHLSLMYRAIERVRPTIVVLDPVSSLLSVAATTDVRATLTRLVDQLKTQGITALMTSLSHGKAELERTDAEISSIVDTWLLLVTLESNGERNRGLYVLKSRGMGHSNQIREFLLTDHGIELVDVYAGAGGVLTGSARLTQQAQERAAEIAQQQEIDRKERMLERLRAALEAELASLRAKFEAQQADLAAGLEEERERIARLRDDQQSIAESRQADTDSNGFERRDERHVDKWRSRKR